MTILKSLQNWETRIRNLKEKYEKNDELESDVKNIEKEIFRVYNILFKNLVIKRIDTDITKGKKERYSSGYNYCLNKEGFSLLHTYNNNSVYIESFTRLVEVLSHYKELSNYLKKPNKKRLIRVFGKEFSKIKENELNISLIIPTKILKQIDESDKMITKITFSSNEFRFYKDKDDYKEVEIRITHLDTDDYVIIEQFYPLLVKTLNNYNKKLFKMIKERKRLLNDLREQFSSELILEELHKENGLD